MSEVTRRCPACGGGLGIGAPQGLCPACLMKRGLESHTDPPGAEQGGAAYAVPTPEELGPYFPELEILEVVGRGGMGVVYKARQKHLDRLVALKILAPSIARDPAFAERFAREARAMAMLSHPHIVTVHDFGQTRGEGREERGEGSLQSPLPPGEGRGEGEFPRPPSLAPRPLYYFLMEYVDGLTLRQLLDAGKLASQEALAIVPQICEGLQFAHDKGVVHRDIKPENILMDRSGQVKIADFGLAKLAGQSPGDSFLTGEGQRMGTPHYMAPEQVEHPQEVDHRADIYSLGVVFYQMLTGELPLGRFAPPSRKVQIDVRLDEVVLRALEKEPERRYQQASQLKTEVETILTTPAELGATGSASVSPADKTQHPDTSPPSTGGARGVPADNHMAIGYIGMALVLLSFFTITAALSLGPEYHWLNLEVVAFGAFVACVVGCILGAIGWRALPGKITLGLGGALLVFFLGMLLWTNEGSTPAQLDTPAIAEPRNTSPGFGKTEVVPPGAADKPVAGEKQAPEDKTTSVPHAAVEAATPAVVKASIHARETSAEVTDALVGAVVERALLSLPELAAMDCISDAQRTKVYVEGKPGIPAADLAAAVDARLALAAKEFPAAAEVVGKAEAIPGQRLPPLPEVRQVETVEVNVNREKMAALGISFDEVDSAVDMAKKSGQNLVDFVIDLPRGRKVPLRDIAELKSVRAPSHVIRRWPEKLESPKPNPETGRAPITS